MNKLRNHLLCDLMLYNFYGFFGVSHESCVRIRLPPTIGLCDVLAFEKRPLELSLIYKLKMKITTKADLLPLRWNCC